LVRESIRPALSSGTTVIADRFLDSTTVYQGVARQLDDSAVEFINHFAVGDCLPDITFVLNLDPDEAQSRLLQRTRESGKPVVDRMEQQPPEFYRAVREGYLQLAQREPQRIRVIDTAAAVEEVETRIWQHVEPMLKRKTGS
jgi:dTMP kinase